MDDRLLKQGIDPTLIKRVRSYVEAHPLSSEEGKRVSKPQFTYYGKKTWEQALTALLAGENILLAGPKATGKNVLAENLSWIFHRPRWTVSFHVNSDSNSLIGSDTFRDGRVQFRPGPVYEAALHGGYCILDEINMARNDAVAVLHASLDFRRFIDLPGYDRIDLKEETRFIGTMNYGYMGTRELNEALISRFMVIQVPAITEEELVYLLTEQYPSLSEEGMKQFTLLFTDLQKKSDNAEISTKAIDLRGLLASIGMIYHGLKPLDALEMGIVNKSFDSYEQELIRDVIRLRIPEDWTGAKLFHE